jgi:signal transduction histidine kinase
MNTAHPAQPEATSHLARLATYLQAMREQERSHLARELHDELGALLTGARLDVASLRLHLGGRSTEVDARLAHLSDLLGRGMALKSSIVEGLCPSSLGNLGLVASLVILTGEFAASSGVQVQTDLHEVQLDENTRLAVYRLVQEALTNMGKYAGASKAQVSLRQCNAGTVVSVCDNGRGFDVTRLDKACHGLAGMRHRIEACGGQLGVMSSPSEGTRILAVLPAEGHRASRPRDVHLH